MNAKELITNAIKNASSKHAKARSDHEEWLRRLAAETVERLDDSLPESLRPYVVYAGEYPDSEEARKYWRPSFFKIEAPGFASMAFTAQPRGSSLVVHSIRVGTDKYGTDWVAAIKAAEIKEGIHGIN